VPLVLHCRDAPQEDDGEGGVAAAAKERRGGRGGGGGGGGKKGQRAKKSEWTELDWEDKPQEGDTLDHEFVVR
jgi:hypothetical protein